MSNRSLRWLFAVVLVLAVSGGTSVAARAADGLSVIAYLADPVGTRDADGRFIGTVPQADLPPAPAPVIDVQRGAVLVGTSSGKDVWLDRMDVKLNQAGSVRELCNSLARASSPDRTVAGTMGAGPNCAKQVAP